MQERISESSMASGQEEHQRYESEGQERVESMSISSSNEEQPMDKRIRRYNDYSNEENQFRLTIFYKKNKIKIFTLRVLVV